MSPGPCLCTWTEPVSHGMDAAMLVLRETVPAPPPPRHRLRPWSPSILWGRMGGAYGNITNQCDGNPRPMSPMMLCGALRDFPRSHRCFYATSGSLLVHFLFTSGSLPVDLWSGSFTIKHFFSSNKDGGCVVCEGEGGRDRAWECSLLSVTEVGDDHEGPMGKLSQEGWRLQEVPLLPSASPPTRG